MSIVVEVFIIRGTTPLFELIKAANTSYSEQMQKLDKVAKSKLPIGLPHHHRWNTILQFAKDKGSEDIKKNIDIVIERYRQHEGCVTVYDKIQDEVKTCDTTKAWDRDTKKLEIAIVPGSASHQLWLGGLRSELIRITPLVQKVGRAPTGDLEYRLQAGLDGDVDMSK